MTLQKSLPSHRRQEKSGAVPRFSRFMVVGLLPLAMISCANNSGNSENQAEASGTTAQSSSESAKPSPTGSETADKDGKGEEPQLQTVALASLKDPSGNGIHFNAGAPGKGTECFSYGPEFSCIAKAPDNVPNVEDIPGQGSGPFKGRPGAFSVNQNGIKWIMSEGIPPATARLGVGQRVELDNGSCEVPDENTFSCTVYGHSFTMKLPARTVTTTAPDVTGGSGNGAGGAGASAGRATKLKVARLRPSARTR